MLLAADYSQIELRMLAHLSGDATLQDVMRQSGVHGDMCVPPVVHRRRATRLLKWVK